MIEVRPPVLLLVNFGLALSIVALTLSTLRASRHPAHARSWVFFGLASTALLLHAGLELVGAEFAAAFAAASTTLEVSTTAFLGVGFALLYGADRDGVSKIQRLAEQDTLTGLYNLFSFRAVAEPRLARARAHGGRCTIVVLDLDGFKAVNDTFGHPAGDKVLQATAACIVANLRPEDLAARCGGDEFAIYLDRCDRREARRITDRIRRSLVAVTAAASSRVTFSAGIATFPESGTDVQTLIQRADAMLLLAKRGGKNDIRIDPRGAPVARIGTARATRTP